MQVPRNESGRIFWLRNLLCGMLIGAGAILPGVSGGVLAVVFGIYAPCMEILSHPRTGFLRHREMLLPLGIGWAVGFVGVTKGVMAALHFSDAVTIWLFIGLILGTAPALFRQAGKEGRHLSSWISMAVCAMAVFAGLFYIRHIADVAIIPNFWWYNFCGVLLGLGMVIPGLTSSSVLMALELYEPLMEGLAMFDLSVILACLPGMIITVVLTARIVSWFFRRHYHLAFHGIFGMVLASTLVIVPVVYKSLLEVVLSLVCCLLGFWLAFFLARMDQRIQQS